MHLSKRGKRRLIATAALLALAALAVAGVAIGRSIQKERLAVQARSDGMTAHQAGDYEAALEDLSYYMGRHPDDLETLLIFADARAKVHEPNNAHLTSALGLYNEALKLDPRNRTALDAMLRLNQELGRRVEWMEFADRILTIDPDDLNALAAKADGHYHARQFDRALEYGERISALQPEELQWRWFQIKTRRAAGQPDHALLAACDEWIKAYEGDGRFHLLKVQLLLELGLRDEAREAALAAAEQGADSLEILHGMVSLLDALQLREKGSDVIARAKQEFPNQHWVHETSVRRLWQSGRLDEAEAELREARATLGSFGRGLLRWEALVATAKGETDRAGAALDELEARSAEGAADDRDADRAWVKALRARAMLDDEHRQQAIAAYEAALALDATDPILHYLLGEAYASADEHELAIAAYRRAASLDQHWLAPPLALAESLLMAGRPEQSLEVMTELVARRPNAGVQAWVLLARGWVVAARSGDLTQRHAAPWRRLDVVGGLNSLRQQFPDNEEVLTLLAEALVMQRDLDAARDLLAEAIASESTSGEALATLAELSRREGLGQEQALIEAALARDGLSLDIARVQARILHDRGRADEAIALFNELATTSADEKEEAILARAAFLDWAEHPSATSALREALEMTSGARAAQLVLAHEPAWSQPELIDAAIGRLTSALGEDSLRVRMAEAARVLAFQADDRAALARATASVGRVLNRAPDSLAALSLMSRLMLAGPNDDPGQAIAYLQRAIDLHPGRLVLYPKLIALLQQEGDYAAADRYLRRLGERAGDDPSLRRAEVALLEQQGDFDTAVLRLAGLVEADSDESQRLALASLYVRAGRHEKAEEIFEQLLESPGRSANTVRLAANFYADTGRFERGLALMESLEFEDAPARKAMLLGAYFDRAGRARDAEAHLREAIRLDESNETAWDALAQHFLTQNDYEQARHVALAGLERRPESQQLATSLALASLRLSAKERSDALQRLRLHEQVDPALLDTLTFFDRAAGPDGEPATTPAALREVRGLLRQHEQFLPAWQLAILMHSRAGEHEEAARLARQAAAQMPSRAEPARWATLLLIDLQRWREALEMASAWRSRSLAQPLQADQVLASIYLELDQPRSAEAQLAPHVVSIFEDPKAHGEAVAIYLRALLASHNYARAEQVVAPLLDSSDRWRGMWLVLAREVDADLAYQMIERVEPALSAGASGQLALAGEWHHLGVRLNDESMLTRAEALARRAAEDSSLIAPASLLLASLAERRGDPAEAETHYRRVLANDADHVVALNNLALLLLQAGQREEEAGALAARAVELAPSSPDVLDTRAQALLALRRFAEAESIAREAARARIDDPIIALTLARSLLGQQKLDESAEELQRAERLLAGGSTTNSELERQIESVRAELDRRRERGPHRSSETEPTLGAG